MKKAFLLIFSILFLLTSTISEASKYRHSTLGYGHHNSIFGRHAQKNKSSFITTKSVFEPRPKFRKSTRDKALAEAQKNPDGSMSCPTCDKKITGKKLNGRNDYDLDHHPVTWSDTKKKMKNQQISPSRKEVNDKYQENVRVQCPKCNRSHKFEGRSNDQEAQDIYGAG